MNHKDSILVEQVLKGNKSAIQELYDQYEKYWFRICLRYGRSRSEGQDIFQDGVTRVFQNLKKFNPERGEFKSWANRVIINSALQYLKKDPSQLFEELELAEENPIETGDIIDQITAKELTQIIQQLPAGYRVVFNMFEIEGYSHKEIASALGITVGTSKSQLSKAKKALQKKLNVLFK